MKTREINSWIIQHHHYEIQFLTLKIGKIRILQKKKSIQFHVLLWWNIYAITLCVLFCITWFFSKEDTIRIDPSCFLNFFFYKKKRLSFFLKDINAVTNLLCFLKLNLFFFFFWIVFKHKMSSDQSPQPAGKSRVYFGSLEGQESIKRPRIEETTASSGGGIDLDALGTFFFFLLSFFKKKN